VLNLRSARTLLVTTLRLPEQRRGMEREGGGEGKEQKKRSEKKGRDLQKSAITAKQSALNARKPLVGVDVGVFANTYFINRM